MKTLKLLVAVIASIITTSLHAQVPQILSQPSSQTVGVGSNFTVNVTATGTGILYYWYTGATNLLTNGTDAFYTVTGATATNAGNYFVVVTNSSGAVTSSVAAITVLAQPAITVQPVSSNAATNTNVVVSVTATGGGSLAYQWYKDGSTITNATSSSYTVSGLTPSYGTYTVTVTNLVGSVTSSGAVVYIVAAPTVATAPTNKTVAVGGSASFTVACSNAAASLLNYQWTKSATNIPGGTNATLTLASLTTNDSGSYTVTVSNLAGTVSQSATLTVVTPVSITTSPAATNVGVGTNVTLTVVSAGDSLTYQWRKGTTNIVNATNATYTITGAAVSDSATYSVFVSNAVSSATSAGAVVLVVDVPVIGTQPAGKTLAVGANYTLSVVCSNASTSLLNYFWSKDSSPISNATNSTLALTNVTSGSAGSYTVLVSNLAGTVTSSAAVIVVKTPITITTNLPAFTNAVASSNVTLIVGVSGDNPAYQWRKGSSNIANATNLSYTLSNAALADSATYSVVITNAVSSVTSSNEVVTIVTLPGITTQPASTGVALGGTVTLSVTVSNTALVTYSWFHGTNAISNSNTNSLKVAGVTTNDAGGYSVVVTNLAGSVTSSVATVTILYPPAITTDIFATNVAVGSNFTMNVTASGGLLSYAWFNGTNVLYSTNSSVTVTNPQTTDSGNYFVVVTNSIGSVTSSIVPVQVVATPFIVIQPKGKNLVTGTNYNLYIIMQDPDTSLLNYQWLYNGAPIDSATSSNLYLASVTSDMSGLYSVVVTNLAGSVTSAAAVITIQAAPVITTQPVSTNLVAGTNFTLSVSATGDSLAYQWYKGTNAVNLATNSTLVFTGATTNDSGVYSVTVTNAVGKLTSSSATVYVVSTPVITVQPVGASVVVGSDYSFSVTVGNATTSLLNYQWLYNGAPIDGANASTLSLIGVGQNDSGSYSVIVSNLAGSVTSSSASLIVQTLPTIITQPASTNLATNGTITLNVNATGGLLAYQWYRVKTTTTNLLASQTNSSLIITNAQVTNSASYFVTLSNAMGMVASAKAAVVVVAAPVIITQPASTNVVEWSDVTFSVGVTNAATSLLSYQWLFDGQPIDQATNSTLTLTEVFTDVQGDFSVIITNLAGAVTSSVATLNVAVPVSVISGPVSTNLAVGGTIDLKINATGNLLQYQWAKNFTNIPGATLSNLTILNAVLTNSATYTVTVTNIAGSYAVTSAVVLVVAQPIILTNPVSQNIGEGDDVTFSLSVSNANTSLLNYQWYFESNTIPGATNKDLTLQYVTTDRAGHYQAVVTNLAGGATSSVATLIVETYPTITAQPVSTNLGAGVSSNFTLSVTATGAQLHYQWYKDSGVLTNQTASTYTVTDATTNASGTYAVVVTNDVGAVTSSNAVVNVVNAPTIVTDITDQTVADGDACSFTVVLANAGSSLLGYQWYYNTNVAIDGATSDTLEFVVGASDAGKYSVVITNVAGVVTSTIANLTVLEPVAITNQPVGTNVGVGTNAVLVVGAQGGGTLTYQWKKDGVDIGGATTATLTVTAATSSYGLYSVAVSNAVSSEVSDEVPVRIIALPTIVTNLSTNTYVMAGTNYTLTVVMSNPGDQLAYQWMTNGAVLANATNASLTLSSLSTNDSPFLSYLVITNIAGTLSSFTNTLNIEEIPSIATNVIAATNIAKGGSLILSVVANGSLLNYQWYRGTHVVGTNSSTLTITNVSVTDSGTYSVVITNDVGTVTSSNTQVLVVAAPVVTTSPVGGSILATSNFTFTVAMRNPTNSLLAYQWVYGTNSASATNVLSDGTVSGVTIAGSTTNSLSITSASTNNSGFYSVIVTNLAGGITSAPVQLKVQNVPAITGQPQTTNVPATSNIVLTVTATGDYLGFQWRKGTNFLSAPSSNVFTLTNAAITDSGNYSVIVTNAVGSATSAVASVVVVAPPVITTQPIGKAVPVGSNFTFSVVLSNASISQLAYQWYFGTDTATNAVPSGTTNTLPKTGLTTNDSGVYFVVVTNIAGSVTSSVVTLKVQTRPTIVTQPADTVVGISNALTLNVTAAGEGIGYQWRKGGVNILNASASNYVDSSMLLADAGTYSVYITNGVGSILSSNAVVKVVTTPVITKQPTSRSIITGTTTTLSVTVSNALAQVVSYQWQKGITNIPNATNNSYQLVNVTNTDSGNYTVIVSNAATNVTSDVAVVIVQTRPVITQQPTGTNVGVGTNFTLSVTATGDGVGYQWQLNGSNILGAVFYTNVVTGAATNNSGLYSVVISNAVGTVTSSNAQVYVVATPAIATQPVSNVVVGVGSNYTFSVIASNAANSLLSYQWQFNGTNIDSATSSKLLLRSLDVSNSGVYTVIITNLAGSITSSNANLLVLAKPAITNQPDSTNVGAGQATTLLVEASGGMLQYQWRKGSAVLVGATNNSLTLSNLQSSNAGLYSVVITNRVGKVISSNASVQVVGLPVIYKQPTNVSVAIGSNALFSVSVTNVASTFLTYQWYSITNGADTNVLATGTNTSLLVTNISTNLAGSYWVIVSNIAGTATSSVASLAALNLPTITNNPTGTNVPVGSNIVLSVAATGSNLRYQWLNGSKTVKGQTNATLTITNAVLTNAGTYSVVVSNAIGKATSSNAIVRVIAAPGISKQPVGGAAIQGSNFTFSITMSNAAASYLSYQWYKGSSVITNATTNTYKITGLTTNDAGTYSVVVTNIAGTVTSTNVTLAVQVKPLFTLQPLGTNIGVGTNITLTATASGTSLGYQWKLGSKAIAGATNNTLAITSAVVSNAGVYTLTVSNAVGKIVSSNAVVTVVAAPGISKQPVGKSMITGTSYTLTVAGSNASSARLTYQWTKGGTNIPSATTNSFAISSATTNDSGTYAVVLSNEAGSVTSTNAIILVEDKPIITSHPMGTNIAVSNTITLNVTATGTSLHYTWRQGTNVLTAFTDTNTLVITNAVVTNSGTYSVIVSNDVGKVTSSNAIVRVVDIPVFTTQPTNGAIGLGSNFTFIAKVATNSLLSYRWTLNGVPIDTGTTNVFKVTGAGYDDAGDYALIVTNLAGAATSSVATLTVQAKPIITVQPPSKTVVKTGTNVALTVTATGDSLFYQWRVRHGSTTTNVLGATNSTLSISSPTTNDTGTYSVVVTNLVGTATSGNAILTVLFLKGTNWVERGSAADTDTTSEFAAAAGSYNGLFSGSDALDKTSAGLITVSITPNLAYSGKLQLDGESVGITGLVGNDGATSATFKRASGKGNLTVDWSIDLTNRQLTGSVSSGVWKSSLTADLAEPAPGTAGSYKVAFPALGITGAVTVSATGDLVFVGVTDTGVAVTQTSQTSADGYWPLFIPVSSGKAGEIIGWVKFTNGAPSGTVSWLKADGTAITSPVSVTP